MNTKISDAVEAISARFRSGNSVPVERASVTREEWESLISALHPQPAALNEVSGNSGELGGDDGDVEFECSLIDNLRERAKGCDEEGLDGTADLLLEAAGALSSRHRAPFEIRICEISHVFLKPNIPYVFTVDPNCDRCREVASNATALAATGKQQVGECATASAMLGEEERPRSPVQMADALERIAGGALADYEGCEADELHILRCAKLIRDLASRQPVTVNESDYADLPDIFDGRDAGSGVV